MGHHDENKEEPQGKVLQSCWAVLKDVQEATNSAKVVRKLEQDKSRALGGELRKAAGDKYKHSLACLDHLLC